jgi:CheY-like chemotaxis protein
VNCFRGKGGSVSRRGPITHDVRTALRSLSYPNITWPMKSMLLINGSEIIAKLFAEFFEKRGWYVTACGDRACAVVRLAGEEDYDVILLSDRVRGTNGVELVRLIRSFEHRKRAAVVMVTGSDEVTEEALAAGADEVLLKPVNPYALVWVVDKHVA